MQGFSFIISSFLISIQSWRSILKFNTNYLTSCTTTIIVPCVAHLYDINTDEHIA